MIVWRQIHNTIPRKRERETVKEQERERDIGLLLSSDGCNICSLNTLDGKHDAGGDW